jgi:cobalt/nickel transport system permease protein
MGVMAAFIFAAQMINFPIAGGTSGHLLGAALATVLLGPWCASITITTVLVIQCLFFQDGGVTALGANVLNMAIIGPLVAMGIYTAVTRLIGDKKGVTAGAFIAAWASVVAAAAFAALELAFSGTVPFKVVFPAMIGWHVLIGFGEGLITAVVVSFVRSIGFGVDWQQKSMESGAGS